MRALSLLALLGLVATVPSSLAAEPPEIRVGLLAFEGQFEDWSSVLADFEASDPGVRYRVALGTYAELLHWMEQGWIDAAVLSPAQYVLGQDAGEYPRAAADFEYVATVGYPSGEGVSGYRHTYRSVCVVRADSRLRTLDDVKAAHSRGELVFVFGHPLSTSSRVAPEHALRGIGIEPDRDHVEFAQSHTNVLHRLVDPTGEGERVGFVHRDALTDHPELADGVRVVSFPDLDVRELPWDVVVARTATGTETFRRLVLRHRDARGIARFVPLENHEARYAEVARWQDEIGLNWDRHAGLSMSLEEIGSYLEHARRTQPEPPRLAVVLSGGGARCAYQVGAIAALEEELDRLNRGDPANELDIDLVVGTSGGAINALPVALGITASADGRRDFERVWTGLDQREIILFAPALRFSIGVWLGLFRIVLLVALLKVLVRRRAVRAWWLGGLLVASGVLEGILQLRLDVPWDWLGEDHRIHHAWLWFGQGHDVSVALLAAAGAGILVAQASLRRRGSFLRLSPTWLAALATITLLTLPLVSGYHVLLGEETLSRGEGVDRETAKGMTLLVGGHIERTTGKEAVFRAGRSGRAAPGAEPRDPGALAGPTGSRDHRELSGAVEADAARRPLLLRARGRGDGPSPLGARGIDLDRFPERLLEVVTGSGSIFPLFPARTLTDFPVEGEWVELVDGGFAHNSPVEAAVLWGATHLVLIEASPPRGGRGSGLAANVIAAAQHYARQTEQVDRRSSQEVVVFTLSPEEPHPCLLDFADNLVRATIEKGYRDARGMEGDDGRVVPSRRFVKRAGKPVFTGVSR